MNLFNRIAMSLILLIFITSVLLLSLVPRAVIDSMRFVLDVAEYNLDPATQLVGAILGLAVVAGAFLLLVAELRPPARQSVVVAQVAGGTAELTNESVAMRIKRVAESIPGTREAVPTIRSRGRAVDISLRLITDPDIDLPKKTEEVMQAVRAETESRMGIPVSSLRVTVRHGSYNGRPSGPIPDVPRRTEPKV